MLAPIFRTFAKSLAAENSVEFLGKNDFSKLFPRKIPIFPYIFGGKFFRGIFPGKNVRKIVRLKKLASVG
jgi:hypothetical protein